MSMFVIIQINIIGQWVPVIYIAGFFRCIYDKLILRINSQELAIILNTASHWHLYYLSKIALINRTKCTMHLSIINIHKVKWFCMEVCFVHGQLLISMLASCCIIPPSQSSTPSKFIMHNWLWAVLYIILI
jgi:hypothetical protein